MTAWSGSSSRQNQAAQHGQKGSDVFAAHRSALDGAPEIFFDLCKGPPPSGNPLTEKNIEAAARFPAEGAGV